jgi:hypothetical protein
VGKKEKEKSRQCREQNHQTKTLMKNDEFKIYFP